MRYRWIFGAWFSLIFITQFQYIPGVFQGFPGYFMNHKRSHKIGRRAVLAAQRLRSFRSHLSMPGRVATWGPKKAFVPFLPLHSGQSGIKKWSHLRYWLWLYKLCKSSTMWIKWTGSNLHYNWITFMKSDILLVASFWRLLWFHSHVSVPSCHSSHSTAPGLKGPAHAPAVASCAKQSGGIVIPVASRVLFS